jgi:broad specificity phosphatase PhoE
MLWLARHGQTAENARGLLLGRADPPLSAVGRRQAVALARVVPPEGRVVSSPLRRARETAEALGRPVEIDERWIELDYGTLDGCRPADVDEAVWERCRQLTTDARDHDVVVVSHVSPIKAAIAWALEVGDAVAWRMFVRDGSIARIRIDSWGTVLMSFNEVPPIP